MKVELHYIRPDAEQAIVTYARVSNPYTNNIKTSKKLIQYLIRNKHWSPFEMVHATMYIECTRDIARQILRHRSFSFQELSQRYAIVDDFASRECRLQDTENRQNSLPNKDSELDTWWLNEQTDIINTLSTVYAEAIERGIAKEVARAILPEGMAMSKMFVTGSIRSWIHYIQVRTDRTTQKEHREVALDCERELRGFIPDIIKEAINT